MTTHQLAGLLDNLRIGFGDGLKAGTATDFSEMVAAFRELEDQPIKEFLKGIRKANPAKATAAGGAPAGTDITGAIDHIRKVQAGIIPPSVPALSGLKNGQLQQLLSEFKKPKAGTKAELVGRIEGLCVPTAQPDSATPAGPAPELDTGAVEEGLRVYTRLRDDRALTIPEVRSGFDRLREYSKPVAEEIARRLNHPTHGTRAEIFDRLLASLISVKTGQYKTEQILTGT